MHERRAYILVGFALQIAVAPSVLVGLHGMCRKNNINIYSRTSLSYGFSTAPDIEIRLLKMSVWTFGIVQPARLFSTSSGSDRTTFVHGACRPCTT
ncbi:hypothetical protein CABS03_10584 [Colletotrichum abscissum]|uniref:Uncharacterized protein n=3 Tax=Colletotrichum acutatum species complex TaxID=2707335 RepID=A0A9P9X301_9PEZI|nr:uncharacterized protein CTAM01_08794 [Colletotrichum tamarilloi]KAI3533962.1 hypothetical protein CABS02_13392 [Colletotrichum abscissum]KAK1494781.1 hypothetical protein CTAM01_08794 [Colletotrichum tamarilloi]